MSIWFEPLADLDQLTAGGAHCMNGVLGIRFTGQGDDWLRAAMPVGQRTHQPFGRLHGGASVVLAETVCSTAAQLCVDRARLVAVGQEINANHVRPVRDGEVHCTARAEAIGQRSHVWSFRIVDDADRLVCIGRMTAALIDAQRA